MAHTPGPWTLGNNEGFWAADCCVMATDPVLLAPVAVAEVVHTTATEEADNLRLICAAPDLLAACEAALEWIKDYTKAHPMELGPQWTLYEQLEIAIKKAQGS
jgi:hypothetical protein